MPVERLLAASGGLPRLLHGVASEWARMLELRRLADSVGRITADRSGLRAAEDDLVGSIVKLQAARERTEPDARGRDGRLPVQGPGFLPGRRRGLLLRARAVRGRARRARDGRPVPGDRRAVRQREVLGAARRSARRARRGSAARERGAGRSPCCVPGSIRCARSIRRSRRCPTTAGWSWRSTSSRRCSRPAATRRSARPSSTRSWPRCETRAGVRWWSSPCAPTSTVAARRTRSCRGCWAPATRSSARCCRDELRRAIELPARRAGLLVERELVDALVADVEGQPGALPLVSSALLELWQRRDGGALRLSDYEQAGGVRGAVARLAEQAYERLDPAGRRLARRVLLRLAGEGEGDAVVRRRARLSRVRGRRGRAGPGRARRRRG